LGIFGLPTLRLLGLVSSCSSLLTQWCSKAPNWREENITATAAAVPEFHNSKGSRPDALESSSSNPDKLRVVVPVHIVAGLVDAVAAGGGGGGGGGRKGGGF